MTGQDVSAAASLNGASSAAGQPASAARRRGPSPLMVLAIASLGAAAAFIDATIVNIAFPSIERSFGGEPVSSLSWVLNAYNIVFAAFLVAAGRIADLLGRRRMFIFGLALFTVASLLCALAPSLGALIAWRVVQAFGASFMVPASLALVLNAFPPGRRSHGVALLSAVSAAAAGLGPSLGGLLVAAASWRLVFVVNLPIGVAAIVLARRFLVESRAPGRRRMPDLAGAMIFALAIAALVLGVVKGQEWGWDSPRVIGSFAAAVALGALFVWRCTWHRSPIIELPLLRIRTFSVANGMTIITAAGFYGYTLANVLFLTDVWRYSVLEAGLALTPGPFVAAVVARPTSQLVQRIGPRPVLVGGGLVWGGAVLWFVERAGPAPAFLTVWLPGMVMLGVGAGSLLPNISGAAVASAPGHNFATSTALNSVARQVGAALGVAVIVAIIGTPTPLTAVSVFKHAWVFGAACLLTAGLGCLFIGRREAPPAPALGGAPRAVSRDRPPGRVVVPPARRAPRESGSGTLPPSAREESAAEFLGHAPVFANVGQPLREALAARARRVRLTPGEWLFREGDPGDSMYVVRAGRLHILDEEAGSVIRELGRGDAFGELALLTASPRSASVRAVRASDLIAVGRPDFEQLLSSSPALSLGLTRALGEQLRHARVPRSSRRPRPATVAVVGLDDRVPVADLARRLAAALERHLSVTVLGGGEVAAPPTANRAAVYGPLLDRAEAAHDLVLLDGGRALSGGPWTEFCLQQADRILAVTGGGPVPRALAGRLELNGCDLVVCDVTPGTGELDGWASLLAPTESHVLRTTDRDDDLARVARRLAGRSVGIVLSGGGARAFSHIGVLEELASAGIVIDRVTGVSMGAVIGAMFAMGLSAEEIDERCFEEWVQRRPLGDYTLPRHALIRGERVRTMLQRLFGGVLIEELPRSFMSGCTELRSGRLVITRHGLLSEAVSLSLALPILGPPQVRGRDLFVDGSLADNLPVTAMSDLAEGPVIAADVKASFTRPDERGPGEPGARRQRPPSLGETLARVLLLGSANTSEAARRHADLVITPRVGGVGLLEFHQFDAAREAGQAAARQALEQAPAELFGQL